MVILRIHSFSLTLTRSLQPRSLLDILSISFVHTLFSLATNTLSKSIYKYTFAMVHSKQYHEFEWEFHYACSNKTNDKSTYGNQVTSKNDFILTTKCELEKVLFLGIHPNSTPLHSSFRSLLARWLARLSEYILLKWFNFMVDFVFHASTSIFLFLFTHYRTNS